MPRAKKTEEDTLEEIVGEVQEPLVSVKKEPGDYVIKYMGSSDVRLLPVGETLLFSQEPLKRAVMFNPQNGHIVKSTDHPEIPREFWERLVSFDDFQDVTDEYNDPNKEVPKNTWEKVWSPESRMWVPPRRI